MSCLLARLSLSYRSRRSHLSQGYLLMPLDLGVRLILKLNERLVGLVRRHSLELNPRSWLSGSRLLSLSMLDLGILDLTMERLSHLNLRT